MCGLRLRRLLGGTILGTALLAASAVSTAATTIKHVLLISIDGMHALDFINCRAGISGVNGDKPYCPNLAKLAGTGVNYLAASASMPSDSFPGLMALVSGGSPRSVGAFYDVAYDRSLDPPAKTTGNGVAGAPGLCKPGAAPTGTTTEYEEGIDIDQTKLNGGAATGDGGIASIDKDRLERDPKNKCLPVFPWNFVRTNTIFGVAHASHLYTAWSDKHPAYSSVSGPGNGKNIDDYYSPEINSIPVPLPQVTLMRCKPLPDPKPVSSWTDSFADIRCYDSLKVQAILNEINGKMHDGKPTPLTPTTPNLFGMNFQVVSVGQKLIEMTKTGTITGGYLDSEGAPTDPLLREIQFADSSIGMMVDRLKTRGLSDSTLIVISAKHGQSPIDSPRYLRITTGGPITTSPADIVAPLLPFSESPLNPTGIGPTQDDISLLWLSSPRKTPQAVLMLEQQSPATHNKAGIGEIFWGSAIGQMFNPPSGDPRTPDIIVTPNIGVTYSTSHKKLAEHGGFSHDDTNVMMLLSNPSFSPKTVTSPVETTQVAPTILKALGLDPNALRSVQLEHTQVLPDLPF
jgi:hypothetical protein